MSDATAPVRSPQRHLPGEPGIWLFIGGDMVLFSVLFVIFLQYRAEDFATFSAGRNTLSQPLGLLNTLLMLSSSWFVAMATQAVRKQIPNVAPACFALALLCGLGFVVVKYFEYSAKVHAGFTLTSNDFYMFYFVYTGIHLVHVLIGMGVLTALLMYTRSRAVADVTLQHVESGASFWHLVDLLWIVLFALLYLLV